MLKDIIFYDIYRKSWKKADLEFIECIEEKWKSESLYIFKIKWRNFNLFVGTRDKRYKS